MPPDPNLKFDIAPDVLDSGICGIFFTIRGLTNRLSDPEFEDLRDDVVRKMLDHLLPQKVHEDPILSGYRELHAAFGFSNRNFPAAPETLLNNLIKYRSLPRINLLVDIYNLVSLETSLAIGAHDLAGVVGNIHLRPLNGSEYYLPLGSEEAKRVRSGGYAYVDDANDVLCMLDSRQVEKSKVTPETRDSFYILQGNQATDRNCLVAGAQRLISLTRHFCGGQEYYLFFAGVAVSNDSGWGQSGRKVRPGGAPGFRPVPSVAGASAAGASAAPNEPRTSI